MINVNDKWKTVKLAGELYNSGAPHMIADADYIIDRTINKTQGDINQQVHDVLTNKYKLISTISFSNNDFLIKAFLFVNGQKQLQLPENFSIEYLYQYEDGSYSALYNDISFSSWYNGVNKSALFSNVPDLLLSSPEKIAIFVVKNDELVTLDSETIDLNLKESIENLKNNKADSADVYTKLEVDTAITTAISASGSGTTTNLQEANSQDIQAVFNMQYQQASSEVIDPHDNP